MNIHTIMHLLSQTVMITFLVIMMMILIEYLHVKTNGKLEVLMGRKKSFQIVFAAFLGLIPGCIGGFAVVSLFTHRIVGFGALLAALIASFGDEAFFLFSFRPLEALILSGILFVIAIVFGLLVDRIPYFSKKQNINLNHFQIHEENCLKHTHSNTDKKDKTSWKRWIILGAVAAFIVAVFTEVIGHAHLDFFHVENLTNHLVPAQDASSFGLSTEQIIFLSISLCVFILILFVNKHFVVEHVWNHVIKKHFLKIFIWSFVVLFFIDIIRDYILLPASLTENSLGQILLLVMAILIGLIPQSGPHLLFIFLFLDGIIPFGILLANSIVQEGHAGLPLIAESPKHFIWIKAIKIIIAFVIGIIGIQIGF